MADAQDEVCFEDYYNTILTGTILPDCVEKDRTDPLNKGNRGFRMKGNLATVSTLYMYTGTPPHAYGTQAPKVAETVKRAYEFNRKRKNTEIDIGDVKVQRLHWERDDGDFPMHEIHGNFIVSEVKTMVSRFLKKFHSSVDQIAEDVVNGTLCRNSDILTKGRQTFCPFLEQSLTAAKAYKNMYEFFLENGGPKSMSCLEWIKTYFSLFGKKSIKYKTKTIEIVEKEIYNRKEKMREVVGKKVAKVVWKETESEEETNKKLLEIGTRFASYMKHKERGKLERRAIASAGMVLRMFLKIIEDFHLELGKMIEGSTISVGGEEKKAKIISSFVGSVIPNAPECFIVQGTEDATKWNECLAPSCFAAMHKYLFSPEIRMSLGLPPPRATGAIFQRISMMGNFLMACKQIQIGPGVMVCNDKNYRRIEWTDEDIQYANTRTKQWYEGIKHLITDDRKYLRASPGMLMGMLNAGSTTLGLLGVNHRMDERKMRVITLRSSDDSMSKYLSTEFNDMTKCIEMNRRNLCMLGINLSPDKTFFFKAELGEYTSWYMDGSFVSQFGVETASLRPQGKNPPDDFYAIAKGTATALNTLTINHLGATIRLRVGVDGVRRLWRIKRNPEKRKGVKDDVLLLSDGGRNPWNCANCHLIEPCIKERYASTEEEKDYLLKCMNPENPFSEEPDEEMVFSKEMGCLTVDSVENPQTVFHFVRRSNRTVTQEHQRKMFEEEKLNMEAYNILKNADPTILIDFPITSVPMSLHIIESLRALRNGIKLDDHESALFDETIFLLENGKTDEGGDSEDSEFDY